jgi:putative endonuclease
MSRADPDGRGRKARRSGLSGRRAEWLAILWLGAKGYRPLERRFGGKGGEIDLVMKRGRTIAFVEVKARARLDDALIAITPEKRRLVERRIRHWLSRNPWAAGCHLRADAVFLAPWRRPRHVPAAFALVL